MELNEPVGEIIAMIDFLPYQKQRLLCWNNWLFILEKWKT